MRAPLVLLALLFALPSQASDFISELEKNLDDFTVAYSAYERENTEQSQTIVATIEKFLTEQVFSVVSDEKLYPASLEAVNRRAKVFPAAMADLGMKLEIRWEHEYLKAFYRTEGQRRRLYQIPAEAILIMGGMMVGTRSVASPAVVGKYFNTIRNLWIGGSALPLAGAVGIETRMEKIPTPPAVLIKVAQLDAFDYRASAAADEQHQRNIARAIGIVAGGATATYGLGLVAQLGTKNPWGAAALVVFVLGSSMYIGATTEDLSEWSFALASEEKLEQDVSAAMYNLYEAESPTRTNWSWAPSWLKPKWMKQTKFEAVRILADAVLKLQANRDLGILLAEMSFQDQLEKIEAKYGAGPELSADMSFDAALAAVDQCGAGPKCQELKRLVITNHEAMKKVVAKRGGALLDPMTTQWLGRDWLKQTRLSPFVAAERAELKAAVNQWQSPIREYAIWWANSANDAPAWASMQHDAGLKLFHEMLDEEAAKQSKGLFLRKDFPVPFYFDLPKKSDALFLVAARYIRSLNDPSIAHIADVMENRATHYSALLLDITKVKEAR